MANDTPLTLQHARHLLRRTGFGASEAAAAEFAAAHATRGEAASDLLDFKPSGFKPNGRDLQKIHDKWIGFMLKTKVPLQEKLVLFWHDHFATAFSKVGDPKSMVRQNRLFRLNCRGNFKSLVKAVNIDSAAMQFLDTVRNLKAHPNENYARELQELFTLGVKDSAGVANYVQGDVAQIARAFTGWDYPRNGSASLDAFLVGDEHDFSAAYPDRGLPVGAPNPPGNKGIYQETGGFGPLGVDYASTGQGAQEIDRVVDIIFQHKDSEGKNTVARRIARRLIEYFAHPNPSLGYIDAVVTASVFAGDFELTPLLHEIFVHDDFYLTAGPPLGSGTVKSVRWPIDYVVSSLRLLKVKPKGSESIINGGGFISLREHLSNMGQTLFDPPSVFGWDWETAWVSSSSMLARYGFARDLTAGRSTASFRPGKLIDLGLSDPVDIIAAATAALGISGDLTPAEEDVLVNYLTGNGANPTPDLNDYDTRNRKLHGLFALLMQSAAYQLH
jgi:uncharacterized protein (DUF1800 family)